MAVAVVAASAVAIEQPVDIVAVAVVPLMEPTLVAAADSWAVEIYLQPVRAMYH